MMNRWSLPLFSLMILNAGLARADDCAKPFDDVVLPAGVSTIGISTTSLNSDQMSALQGAMAQWNSCGGTTSDFSIATAGDLSIGVRYNARQATSSDCGGQPVCGCFDWNLQFDSTTGKQVITGGTVEIFQTGTNGISCGVDSAGHYLNAIMIHELGHVLGLAQAGTGCSGRPMAASLGEVGDVTSSDCDGAQEAADLANPSPGAGTGSDEEQQDCGGMCSPILIDLDRRGFRLSSPERGTAFDIDGDGFAENIAWIDGGDAFLALDRNGNGVIDDGTELFGNFTDQPPSHEPNGYLALAVFDLSSHGGNDDGLISPSDAVFGELRLWIDRNRNGVTDPGELVPLADRAIEAIELQYRISQWRDRYGNQFRYSANVWLNVGSTISADVILATKSPR
jgi:hypothetical protein